MHSRNRHYTGVALAILFAVPAHAQSSGEPRIEPLASVAEQLSVSVAPQAQERVQNSDRSDDTVLAARSDSGDSTFGEVASGLQLFSGQEGSSVQLILSTERQQNKHLPRTEYALTLNAPFDKNADFNNFITDTGLPNSYSAEVSVGFTLFHPQPPEVDAAFLQRLVTRADFAGQIQPLCAMQTDQQPLAGCSNDATVSAQGSLLGEDALVAMIADEMQRQMEEEPLLRFTLSGAVGYQKYDFRDPVTFANQSNGETLFSLTSSFYYLP